MFEKINAQIAAWRQRWDGHPRWIEDVASCLSSESPGRAACEIVLFPWYTMENGFHPLTFSPQYPSLILDLRGIPLRHLDLRNIVIPFALLEGAEFFKSDLSNADLSYVRAAGANFQQAQLTNASFTAAQLDFSDFSTAVLRGANFSRAHLVKSDLGWADLQEAVFRNAILREAKLERVKAEEADFSRADLRGADLSLAVCSRAGFEEANLGNAQLIAAHLEEANLIRANCENTDCSLAYLNGAYLESAVLRGADLTRVYFNGADLSAADLRNTNLFAAQLTGAGLQNAKLQNASLKSANFYRADLRNADLKGADLFGAELISARLEDADLRAARLLGCRLWSPNGSAVVSDDTLFGWIAEEKNGMFGKKRRSAWLVPPPGSLSSEEKDQLDFNQVRTFYNQVRMLFRDNGFYHRAAVYFEQDNYWRTRSDLWEGKLGQFLMRWILFEKFTGYGEKPLRIFFSGVFLIVIFAVLYLFNGFRVGEHLIDYNLNSAFSSLGTVFIDFWSSLLFSVLCFVTVSSESLRPAGGVSQALSSLEGLSGLFIIVLGGIVFLRKVVRK